MKNFTSYYFSLIFLFLLKMPILNLSKFLEERLSCNLRSIFLLKSFKNLLIEQVSKISKSSKGLSASILSVIPCKIAIFPCFVL